MNESNFIEVNGISFEILVPKQVLVLPKKDLIQKLSDIGKHLSKPPLHPSPGYPVREAAEKAKINFLVLVKQRYIDLGLKLHLLVVNI